MTQEDKNLLLKDLCARLPYKVKCQHSEPLPSWFSTEYNIEGNSEFNFNLSLLNFPFVISNINAIKPYLRPMSSMTEEEADEFEKISDELLENGENTEIWDTVVDWLNAHHFDHRGLIEKGLALEALEGMYKTD